MESSRGGKCPPEISMPDPRVIHDLTWHPLIGAPSRSGGATVFLERTCIIMIDDAIAKFNLIICFNLTNHPSLFFLNG